jgi:hypothetical protein
MSRHPASQLSHLAGAGADTDAETIYAHALDTLNGAGVPYLVGGGFAIVCYTGIPRVTKDLDLFLRAGDLDRALETLAAAGFHTERTHPHWLGKARAGEHCIDLIFNSGNGVTNVDDAWFEHSSEGEALGRTVRFVPAEELAWTKLFVMERERYDGADVAHVLRHQAERLDWTRLRDRVGDNWRVLLSHLILFGFIYPGEQARVPARVLDELLRTLKRERAQAPAPQRLCRGTLLSREQYLHDIQVEHYQDARVTRVSSMNPDDIAAWTDAIDRDSGDAGG